MFLIKQQNLVDGTVMNVGVVLTSQLAIKKINEIVMEQLTEMTDNFPDEDIAFAVSLLSGHNQEHVNKLSSIVDVSSFDHSYDGLFRICGTVDFQSGTVYWFEQVAVLD